MKFLYLFLAVAALAFAGCERTDDTSSGSMRNDMNNMNTNGAGNTNNWNSNTNQP